MSHQDNIILVVRRVFEVEPEILFDAWTRPEIMVRWFHSKEQWTTPVAETDLRANGKWRIEMRTDDGRTFAIHGVYKVIERPHRLVFTWHPFGDEAYETTVTLRFRRLAEGSTELTLTHHGLRNEQDRAGHEGGWSGCLGGLAKWTDSG